LTEEEIERIDSAVPFEYGYPYAVITGNSKPVSANNPGFFIGMAGFFDGVQEAQVSFQNIKTRLTLIANSLMSLEHVHHG
jgi:hypothetical protein